MIIWIDLETTGLDCKTDTILELGMIATDDYGEEMAPEFHAILHSIPHIENDVVRSMHESSGLLAEVREGGEGIALAEKRARDWVADFLVHPSKRCVAGRNVGFDLSFLKDDMPSLEKALGFRTIDILTFERVAKAIGVEFPEPRAKRHRALDDLRDDIEVFRWFTQNMLRGVPR